MFLFWRRKKGEIVPDKPAEMNPHDKLKMEVQRALERLMEPHKIRRMFSATREVTDRMPAHGSVRGDFFLFAGELHGEVVGGSERRDWKTTVTFAWDIGNDVYTVTRLSLGQVRIRLVSDLDVPTVAFSLFVPNDYERYREEYDFTDNMRWNRAIERHICYAIISVSEKDWPANVDLGFGFPEKAQTAKSQNV